MTSCTKPVHKGNLILGYTARDHLLLDLDKTTQSKAHQLAKLIMREWPVVGDCLLVRSSYTQSTTTPRMIRRGFPTITKKTASYHLVFDNLIGYNKFVHICETLAAFSILERSFLRMRYFRGDMTLRVSLVYQTDGVKEAPIPIMRIHNNWTAKHDHKIDSYLAILRISQGLFSGVNLRLSDKYPKNALSPIIPAI